jgi:hypothetical protein
VILRLRVGWPTNSVIKGSNTEDSRWRGLLIKGGAVDASVSCVMAQQKGSHKGDTCWMHSNCEF